MFNDFFKTKKFLNFGFPEVFGGPGGFRKVGEAGRNTFLRILSKSDLMVPSSDQNTQVNE